MSVSTHRTTDLVPAEAAPVWQHSRRISRIVGERARASDIYKPEKFGHNKTMTRICSIICLVVEIASWFRFLPAKRSDALSYVLHVRTPGCGTSSGPQYAHKPGRATTNFVVISCNPSLSRCRRPPAFLFPHCTPRVPNSKEKDCQESYDLYREEKAYKDIGCEEEEDG